MNKRKSSAPSASPAPSESSSEPNTKEAKVQDAADHFMNNMGFWINMSTNRSALKKAIFAQKAEIPIEQHDRFYILIFINVMLFNRNFIYSCRVRNLAEKRLAEWGQGRFKFIPRPKNRDEAQVCIVMYIYCYYYFLNFVSIYIRLVSKSVILK